MGELEMKSNSTFIALLAVMMISNLSSCKSDNINTSSLAEKSLASIDTDSISIENNKKVPIHRAQGNYKTFDSDEELSQVADLVVIGKPMADLDETSFLSYSESESRSKKNQGNESILVRSSTGNVMDAYSIVSFKVQKYLKGDSKEKQIRILQSPAYIQQGNQTSYVWLQEDSSPLQKKSRYILFLKEVDTTTYPNLAGVYSIISVGQGKFNLDKSDSKESEIEGKNDQYRQLKEKVRKRREVDFNSTPDS
jgi:hypothetical protein